MTLGMNVVKVIVPGIRHFWRKTGLGRLYDVPVKLGWLSECFLGKIPPLAAVKPKRSGEIIELYKPDLQTLKQTDPSFTQILEERKSIPEQRQKTDHSSTIR